MSDVKRYVVGFYFASRSVVLGIRKRRPEWQRGKLNGIGGHVEEGESFEAAMVREFEEEAGVLIRSERWAHFCTLHGPAQVDADDFEVRFFVASLEDEDEVPLTCTDEEVAWFPVDSLIKHGVPNLRWLLPMVHPSLEKDWPFSVSRAGGRAEADGD